jgi:soluble lytic murein transglycosylase-like protein
MGTSFSAKFIIPSILFVIVVIASLSIFTGSAYAAYASPTEIKTGYDHLVLSQTYPQAIQQWAPYILEAAFENDLDPNLIAAVMLQESGGDPRAISISGAVGLMQVMPKDGLAASFICDGSPCFSSRPSMEQLLEPEFNIHYGASMLSGLIEKKGSLREALYHYGPIDVGYGYAERVLSLFETYK